jgi:hypothetical protein
MSHLLPDGQPAPWAIPRVEVRDEPPDPMHLISDILTNANLDELFLNFNPAHDKAGKFAKGAGGEGGAPGKKPRVLNRPTEPHERVKGAAPKAKKWVDPPPKKGKKGLVKAGGKIERKTGDESQTVLGDLAESLAKKIGFRDILPKGKRNLTAEEVKKMGSSIDLEYDHSGRLYELKMCATTSTEYRLKAKKKEKDEKIKYAKGAQAEAWTMVGVHDKDAKTIHFYAAKAPGLIGAEVSSKNFGFVGKVSYK